MTSVYVLDSRTLPATNLGAVRVFNGTATASERTYRGHGTSALCLGRLQRTESANLGTANTSATLPASLVADAITILSDAWSDANSQSACRPGGATSTTVNAAFLTGAVETTLGHYSGGMENFPRFLENWGSANRIHLQWFDDQDVSEPLRHQRLGQGKRL